MVFETRRSLARITITGLVRVFGLSLLLALAATILPAGSRPAAQQTATVRGRVVIDPNAPYRQFFHCGVGEPKHIMGRFVPHQ